MFSKRAVEKRTLTFSCRDSDELIRFLGELKKRVHGVNFTVQTRGKVVRVKVYGVRDTVKRASAKIRETFKIIRLTTTKDSEGMYTYPYNYVVEKTGVTAPLTCIVEALKRKGYKVTAGKGEFKTDATLDEVIEVVEGLGEALEEARWIIPTRNVRNLIAIASYLTGIPSIELFEYCLREGLIRERMGRYEVCKSPEKILDELTRLKGEYLEGEDYGEEAEED